MKHLIPSRDRGPYIRPLPYMGRLLIDLPGYTLDWTLRQDMRDMRRFYGVDLAGQRMAHAAPRELMRQVALMVPRYAALDN